VVFFRILYEPDEVLMEGGQRMKRRWKLLAVAAVPGIYWIDQCALPRPALVDAAFAVEGNPVAPMGVRLEHVAAKYLPVGMDEDAALALVKKAGFRVTPELREPRLPSSCPACDRVVVARYNQSILCGGQAISITLGFSGGRVAYVSAARVLREFYI
jgi:hypothetical protein